MVPVVDSDCTHSLEHLRRLILSVHGTVAAEVAEAGRGWIEVEVWTKTLPRQVPRQLSWEEELGGHHSTMPSS